MGRRGAKPAIWIEQGECDQCTGKAYILKMVLWRFNVCLTFHVRARFRKNEKKDLFYIG